MTSKRINICRDKNNKLYLMIKLSYEELFELGNDIQALELLLESRKKRKDLK